MKRLIPWAVLLMFLLPRSIDDGRREMALRLFDLAKRCYQRQETFRCLRYCYAAARWSPLSAAPWILAGHCFYLQGEDASALSHYEKAAALDPSVGILPPFVEQLRRRNRAAARALTGAERNRLRRLLGQRLLISVHESKLTGRKKWMIQSGWAGGVILFGQNVVDKAQIRGFIRRLQAASPIPLFMAVDQEGGAVRRLREEAGFLKLPSLAALGARNDPDLAYRFGRLAGRQLRVAGANMNLAPVVDLDRGLSDSIITKYHRSLGSDPQKVAALASRILAGLKAEGILATAKHYPSQSSVTQDTHREAAVCDESIEELETEDLVPYRRLIREGLDAVMVSHVLYPRLDPYFPASLSHEAIGRVLRGELGFQGLVVSDDLRMGAIKNQFPLEISAVQAVNAGADLLMVTDNMEMRVLDILVDAAADGRIPMSAVEEGYRRILAMKRKYGIIPPKNRTH